jgi:DNA-binding Lrp family transcriptional regulator
MFDVLREKRSSMATVRNNLHFFFETAQTIERDDTTNRLFRLLLENSSSSGWALAKAIGLNPEDVQRGLQVLLDLGVIKSMGNNLDAFYFITAQGYQLKEFLSAPK